MLSIIGCTWLEELGWVIQNDGDVTAAKTTPLFQRVPYLEVWAKGFEKPMIDLVETMPHPRVIKTHLPPRYLSTQLQQGQTKVILIIRNPKDMLVSFYHFYRMNAELNLFEGTWDEFFELFKNHNLLYGDYFDWYGDWLSVQKSASVLLVKYESMKGDLRSEIKRIASYIGKALSDDAVDTIVEHCSFNSMMTNNMVNYKLLPDHLRQDISPFMRKGVVGDWKNYFSEEQSNYMDELYQSWHKTHGVTLQFE